MYRLWGPKTCVSPATAACPGGTTMVEGAYLPCCSGHIYEYKLARDGEGESTPLQYSCLENPKNGGAQ